MPAFGVGGPSHGHRQHAWNIWWSLDIVVREMCKGTKTPGNVYTLIALQLIIIGPIHSVL